MLNKTPFCNIPKSIEDKLWRKLHNQKNHPIQIMKDHIYEYFKTLENYKFNIFDNLSQVVSIQDNFDKLLIPETHVARSKSDTYYVNELQVLRTHTSAHQNELLAQGFTSFLVTGDVYRKDEVDSRHYPVFHQMEMLTLTKDNLEPVTELKRILSGLIEYLFPGCEYRYNPDYFPFTEPSFEVEVMFRGNWLEILGCGIVQPKILENNGLVNKNAIAVGLGLERLVMIMTDIPDIRYLWSTHERFSNQFAQGKLVKFEPYSELPSQTRDISFYMPIDRIVIEDIDKKIGYCKWLDENDFFEIVRDCDNDMMEEVKLLDSFYNKKFDKYSRTYRLQYSPNDPNNKDPGEFFKIVNDIQSELRDRLKYLKVELR